MKNGCILTGDVGTGKSHTAIAYYFIKDCGGELKLNGFGDHVPMRKPKDLYIITTARKRDDLDWEKTAIAFGLSTKFELSVNGVQVYVDSWNNIEKYKDVENAFFIFDEQRVVGYGLWTKTFLQITKSNNWILLSATPGDTWMDFLPVFIANGFFKNKTEFERAHVVYRRFSKFPQIERYVDTGILERYKRSVSVDMPYPRHTTRHIKLVNVEYDKKQLERIVKQRWHIYEERPLKDVGEMFMVMRKLVNSDTSRLKAICDLIEEKDRLIIFYNFNYELDDLRGLAKLYDRPVAEWNGHKHEQVPGSDKWIYLVQYTAGAEGWNCITTDAIAFYSLNYSYKINHQARGRIDRLNTPYKDLFYYILCSNSLIDKAIMKSLREKKDFNELKYLNK
jgi:hypothetical protein